MEVSDDLVDRLLGQREEHVEGGWDEVDPFGYVRLSMAVCDMRTGAIDTAPVGVTDGTIFVCPFVQTHAWNYHRNCLGVVESCDETGCIDTSGQTESAQG